MKCLPNPEAKIIPSSSALSLEFGKKLFANKTLSQGL